MEIVPTVLIFVRDKVEVFQEIRKYVPNYFFLDLLSNKKLEIKTFLNKPISSISTVSSRAIVLVLFGKISGYLVIRLQIFV